MNPRVRVRVLAAGFAVIVAALLSGCSYSTESLTQKSGPMDHVVEAPTSDA